MSAEMKPYKPSAGVFHHRMSQRDFQDAEEQPTHEPSVAPNPHLPLVAPAFARPADIISLQRIAGNAAVSNLLQTKLIVGAANDPYEQEADRVAGQVMDGFENSARPAARSQPSELQRNGQEQEEVQTKTLAASIAPLVQRLPEEEEEIQSKPSSRYSSSGFEVNGALEDRLKAGQGSGSPLPDDVRLFMEPRFGADFSGVNLHTGSESAQMNKTLNALAFTHGQDIYLGENSPAPGTPSGNRLLAHELTHVIQQSRTGIRRISRWGGPGVTQHEEVTWEGIMGLPENIRNAFSFDTKKYLADHSDDMDWRGGLWASQAKNMFFKQKLAYKTLGRGMYASHAPFVPRTVRSVMGGVREAWNILTGNKGKEEEQKKQETKKIADDWTNIVGYDRDPAEAPNHAEAGLYRENKASVNIARRNEYVNNAITAWKSKNPNQALQILSLALHCAQDRGSHGDGRPGIGHDPRQIVPPPNKKVRMAFIFYARNPGWKEGQPVVWKGENCDKKEMNKHGYEMALRQTMETLTMFYNGLNDQERLALGQWRTMSVFKDLGRRFGRLVAGQDVIRSGEK